MNKKKAQGNCIVWIFFKRVQMNTWQVNKSFFFLNRDHVQLQNCTETIPWGCTSRSGGRSGQDPATRRWPAAAARKLGQGWTSRSALPLSGTPPGCSLSSHLRPRRVPYYFVMRPLTDSDQHRNGTRYLKPSRYITNGTGKVQNYDGWLGKRGEKKERMRERKRTGSRIFSLLTSNRRKEKAYE